MFFKQQATSCLCCKPWHNITAEQDARCTGLLYPRFANETEKRLGGIQLLTQWVGRSLRIWQMANQSQRVWWFFFDGTVQWGISKFEKEIGPHEFLAQRQSRHVGCLKWTDRSQNIILAHERWKPALSVVGKQAGTAASWDFYLPPCLFLSVPVLQKSYFNHCR